MPMLTLSRVTAAWVVQQVLLLLGNLCSDSVDSASALTKRALLRTGAERALFSCVEVEDDDLTVLFACGALQNLCHDMDWSEKVVDYGVDMRLEDLLHHDDVSVVRPGPLCAACPHLPRCAFGVPASPRHPPRPLASSAGPLRLGRAQKRGRHHAPRPVR